MLNVNHSCKSLFVILATFVSIQGHFLLFIARIVRQELVCDQAVCIKWSPVSEINLKNVSKYKNS